MPFILNNILGKIPPHLLKLLPFFAPFRHHITVAADLLDEYVLLIADSDDFHGYDFQYYYDTLEYLGNLGLIKQAEPNWDIVFLHPSVNMQLKKLFSSDFNPNQQKSIQSCFVEYYDKTYIPQAILPYINAPNADGIEVGEKIARYEFYNLCQAIEWALKLDKMSENLLEGVDLFLLKTGNHILRVSILDNILNNPSKSLQKSTVFGLALYRKANALQLLMEYEASLTVSFQQLELLSEQEELKGFVLQQIGVSYRHLNQHQEAENYFKQALIIFEKYNNQARIAEMYHNLGVLEFDNDNHENSLLWSQKAHEKFKDYNYQHYQGLSFFNQGSAFLKKGNIEQAKAVFEQALSVFRRFDDDLNIANVLRALGIIESDKGDWVSSEAYFQQALQKFIVLNLPNEQALAYADLGSIALKRNIFEDAIHYYNLAIKKDVDTGQNAKHLHMLAFIYHYYQKQINTSIPYYRAAIEAFDQTDDFYTKIEAMYNYGNAYFELKQFNNAIDVYLTIIAFWSSQGLVINDTIAFTCHNLSLAYYKMHCADLGKKYAEMAKSFYIDLNNIESLKELDSDIGYIITQNSFLGK